MEDFDRFLSAADYPMYVLTVPGPSGCLVGFTTQCSISPPRFLACLSKANHTYQAGATVVGIHQLGADDLDLAQLFGSETGDTVDKFQYCGWTEGPDGVPLLDRCATWFVGSVEGRFDLGDHDGLLLAPTMVSDHIGSSPLMYSAVRGLQPGHPS